MTKEHILKEADEACQWLETMATGANIHRFRSLSNKIYGWKINYDKYNDKEAIEKLDELLERFRKIRTDFVAKTPFPRWG